MVIVWLVSYVFLTLHSLSSTIEYKQFDTTLVTPEKNIQTPFLIRRNMIDPSTWFEMIAEASFWKD